MKRTLTYILTAVASMLLLSGQLVAQERAQVEKLWEVNEGLATPESVVYDSLRSCLYVSSFNDRGGFRHRNDTLRDEYLSKIDLEGNILELKWVDGLLGPTGLAIRDDVLYVVERGGLLKVDIGSQEIIERIPVPGTVFLNDIALDRNGDIYLSDSRVDGTIYQISEGKAAIWLSDSILRNCNGLFLDGNLLIVGTRGKANLVSVSIPAKEISIMASELAAGMDGIRKSGQDYILSWQYEILLADERGQSSLLLSTEESDDWNADMEYIPGLNMLIVPTLLTNKLIAYRLHLE